MARTTTWVLTLVLTCTPLTAASPRASLEQGRTDTASPASGNKAAQTPKKNDRNTPQPAVAASRPEGGDRWKWWLYDRAELGITDQQSAAINGIFEATIVDLRAARQELDRAEEELSRTIKEHKADIAVVSLQLDRVESARSHHNKLRTLMLYRIHALLSAEQRGKLQALRARRSDKPASGR